MMKIFLDDERFPVDDSFTVVRTVEEAIVLIENIGFPKFISFDHDLGTEKTGYDFAKWICDHIMDNNIDVTNFDYYVHSQNPIGRDNINNYMTNFLNYYRDET